MDGVFYFYVKIVQYFRRRPSNSCPSCAKLMCVRTLINTRQKHEGLTRFMCLRKKKSVKT